MEVQHFKIEVDGQLIPARRGQTIAAALMVSGQQTFRRTASGAPRGLFCGMGICFDCLVTVDGITHQRACMRLVEPGMQVRRDTGEDGNHGDD